MLSKTITKRLSCIETLLKAKFTKLITYVNIARMLRAVFVVARQLRFIYGP